jgi:hypothetical protein
MHDFMQVIFATIVYRQIISLIIHCITTEGGQKIPENYVMGLENSDRN